MDLFDYVSAAVKMVSRTSEADQAIVLCVLNIKHVDPRENTILPLILLQTAAP